MTEELAGKVLDAYRTSPLLTGLLLINAILIGGFGWWEFKRVGATDTFVQQQLAKQDALNERLIAMAKECNGVRP